MNALEELENLKKKIDDLKVKKMASEAENSRLEKELNGHKKCIKEVYGVEIEDFSEAIETMKKELNKKIRMLTELVTEAERKLGIN